MKYFEIFNITPSYNINKTELETKMYELQKLNHPNSIKKFDYDNSTKASDINIAYKCLANNLTRAAYIVKIWYDFDLTKDGTVQNDFVMEYVFDIQTSLFEITHNNNSIDREKIDSFRNKITNKIELLESTFKTILDKKDDSFKQEAINNVMLVKFLYDTLKRL